MSAVPAVIAGIGSVMSKLRVSPSFDPLRAQIGPDEYFVFSRIDGNMTLRDILLSTGLPVERGVQIVLKLRELGALLLPGETAPPPPPKPAPAPPPPPVAPPPAQQPPPRAHTAPIGNQPLVPPAQAAPSAGPHGIAIPRTSTPMTPMAGGKLPAKPATPPQGVPAVPAIPAIPSIPSIPAVPRTTTPMTPMGGGKLPARPAPEPPLPSLDLDAPTNLRTFEPPTQQRSDRRGPPSQPPAPDVALLDPATVRRAPTQDINVVLPKATDAERAALAEPGDLGPDERLRLLAMSRLVGGNDPYALLGVPHGADAKTLKRAYFKLSKDVHPDRYYGKKLGSFADRLATVFEAVSRAYAQLTAPPAKSSRAAAGGHQSMKAEQPQTPQEYAAELFERACGLEVGGDPLGAMKLFAAAVRIDSQTKFLKRAASCALAAEQPKTALEYAKKAQGQAPNDPSLARLLANAFKATGKYADAEEVLIMAMALKSENDVLTAELRHDLAEVRRLMAG